MNDLLKLAIEGHGGLPRWEHSMHHPYQAGHGRSPSAAESLSAAAVPGGA